MLEAKDLGEAPDKEGLCEAWDADEQGVSVGEEADEKLLDDFVLADDPLAQLALDGISRLSESLYKLNITIFFVHIRASAPV